MKLQRPHRFDKDYFIICNARSTSLCLVRARRNHCFGVDIVEVLRNKKAVGYHVGSQIKDDHFQLYGRDYEIYAKEKEAIAAYIARISEFLEERQKSINHLEGLLNES